MNVYVRGLELLARYRDRRGSSALPRLLDVGCNAGVFMMLAQNAGYLPSGVEQSVVGAWTGSLTGCPVFSDLRSVPSESVDVITLWDVLEHTDRPRDIIRDLARIAKPGGLLAIKVPDGRTAFLLHKLRPRSSGALGIPEHVQFFNRGGLRRLMTDHGFEIKRLEKGVVEQAVGAPLAVRLKRVGRLALSVVMPSSITMIAQRRN